MARTSEDIDPVVLELIAGTLGSAQLEMETLLERTAMSPFIREKKDFLSAFYDENGDMVAGTKLPLFGRVVEPILEHYPVETIQPGDLFWYNDTYGSHGAISHSPDQMIVAPVFAEGLLSGWSQTWAHLTDIGGMHPGSLSPKATSIFQEGIMVPPVRVQRAGVPDETLLRVFERNSRFPEMVRGDMRALFAATRLGQARMVELFGRFGRATVLKAFKQIQDRTAVRVRKAFRDIFANGEYSAADIVDSDGQGNGPYKVRLDLRVDDDRAVLDTRRTDDQAPGPINFVMHPVVPSLLLGVYLTSDREDPMNGGTMRVFDEVLTREGSLFDPVFPAPTGQRSLTWIRLGSALLALVNQASGGKGAASSSTYSIYYMRGIDAETGETFLVQDGVGAGYGARPFADGLDVIYYVSQENYPAEFLNDSFPVRVARYEINADSGGPGRYRGGTGVIREVEVLAERVMLMMRIGNTANPPWGVSGGQSGRAGRGTVNPGTAREAEIEPFSDGLILERGDILRVMTGGGGGWGDPFDRPPEEVLADVLGGFVSREGAERDYGVALVGTGHSLSVEKGRTAALRGVREHRDLFHRQEYLANLT